MKIRFNGKMPSRPKRMIEFEYDQQLFIAYFDENGALEKALLRVGMGFCEDAIDITSLINDVLTEKLEAFYHEYKANLAEDRAFDEGKARNKASNWD